MQYIAFVEGPLALAQGNPRGAITRLEKFIEEFKPARGTQNWARAVLTLANARRLTADVSSAIALLEDATRNRREYLPESPHAWLPLRDRLAQLYRQVGRASEADAIESNLLALLGVADEDHPIKRRILQRMDAVRQVGSASRPRNHP